MQYRVYIDANTNHMDTSTRSVYGVYDTAEQAIDGAHEVISAQLVEAHRQGMTAEEVLEQFVRRGEMPFILPEDQYSRFDRLEFALERARKLCWREELRSREG